MPQDGYMFKSDESSLGSLPPLPVVTINVPDEQPKTLKQPNGSVATNESRSTIKSKKSDKIMPQRHENNKPAYESSASNESRSTIKSKTSGKRLPVQHKSKSLSTIKSKISEKRLPKAQNEKAASHPRTIKFEPFVPKSALKRIKKDKLAYFAKLAEPKKRWSGDVNLNLKYILFTYFFI